MSVTASEVPNHDRRPRKPAPRIPDGDRVRRYRIARGWNQVQLADRAGIGRAIVTAVENRLQGARIDSVGAIAKALGVHPFLLMTDEYLAHIGVERPPDVIDAVPGDPDAPQETPQRVPGSEGGEPAT